MKIANIIEEGKLGGPQLRIIMVAKAVSNSILTTIIMPRENSNVFQDRCEKSGVSCQIMSITRLTKDWAVLIRYILFSWLEIIHIASYLKKNKFDLIHVSGGSWQYKGVIAGKLAGKKILWHINDTYMPWLIRKIFSNISRFASGFIYSSNRSKDYYGGSVDSNKMNFIIPPPVDTDYFNPIFKSNKNENNSNNRSDEIIIGTVANINPVKGLDIFIRMANILTKTSKKCKFIIAGPVFKSQVRYQSYLNNLCDKLSIDNIEFVGSVTNVRELLSQFDIFVCSSFVESGPMSLFEAMAMAKPVVSTNVGDVPLYIQDGVSGFIVNVGNYNMMAKRLVRLIENEDLRKTFGERAREIAVESLDLNKCAQRHLDAYKMILQKEKKIF